MESNGIGNNDAATLALLGGGYNGIGIGNNRNYGTDVLAAGALADGTAAKASSEAHSSQLLAAVDRLGAQSSDTQIILREEEVNKNITDSEFRAIAREQTIQAELVDNAKEAAKLVPEIVPAWQLLQANLREYTCRKQQVFPNQMYQSKHERDTQFAPSPLQEHRRQTRRNFSAELVRANLNRAAPANARPV